MEETWSGQEVGLVNQLRHTPGGPSSLAPQESRNVVKKLGGGSGFENEKFRRCNEGGKDLCKEEE